MWQMDFRLLDPDEMTPEQRFERIAEIFADAVIRLAVEECQREKGEIAAPVTPESSQPQTVLDPCTARTGRIPFGQSGLDGRRVINPEEQAWILRIRQLAVEGCSAGVIADNLNKEDCKSRRAGKWSKVAVWRILKAR